MTNRQTLRQVADALRLLLYDETIGQTPYMHLQNALAEIECAAQYPLDDSPSEHPGRVTS